jgi:hypothetical protein
MKHAAAPLQRGSKWAHTFDCLKGDPSVGEINNPMPEFSRRHRFSDWPNADVPAVAAGVYAVWEGDLLIYCGMSERGFEKALAGKAKLGLTTRLASHASGRLSGDQFCVYIANRLVIPKLSGEQLEQCASAS